MFQYVHAQVVSDNKSERMTKIAIIFNIAIAIAKKIISWNVAKCFGYNKTEANLQTISNS